MKLLLFFLAFSMTFCGPSKHTAAPVYEMAGPNTVVFPFRGTLATPSGTFPQLVVPEGYTYEFGVGLRPLMFGGEDGTGNGISGLGFNSDTAAPCFPDSIANAVFATPGTLTRWGSFELRCPHTWVQEMKDTVYVGTITLNGINYDWPEVSLVCLICRAKKKQVQVNVNSGLPFRQIPPQGTIILQDKVIVADKIQNEMKLLGY